MHYNTFPQVIYNLPQVGFWVLTQSGIFWDYGHIQILSTMPNWLLNYIHNKDFLLYEINIS